MKIKLNEDAISREQISAKEVQEFIDSFIDTFYSGVNKAQEYYDELKNIAEDVHNKAKEKEQEYLDNDESNGIADSILEDEMNELYDKYYELDDLCGALERISDLKQKFND